MEYEYMKTSIAIIIIVFGMIFTLVTAINKNNFGLVISGLLVIIGILLFAYIMDKTKIDDKYF